MDRDEEALRLVSAFHKINNAEARKLILKLIEAVARGAKIEAIASEVERRGDVIYLADRPKRD